MLHRWEIHTCRKFSTKKKTTLVCPTNLYIDFFNQSSTKHCWTATVSSLVELQQLLCRMGICKMDFIFSISSLPYTNLANAEWVFRTNLLFWKCRVANSVKIGLLVWITTSGTITMWIFIYQNWRIQLLLFLQSECTARHLWKPDTIVSIPSWFVTTLYIRCIFKSLKKK